MEIKLTRCFAIWKIENKKGNEKVLQSKGSFLVPIIFILFKNQVSAMLDEKIAVFNWYMADMNLVRLISDYSMFFRIVVANPIVHGVFVN